MVKKISFYTAFRQFLEMVERQAELELEALNETDRLPISHTLSDYQDGIVTDLQVRSCPAAFSVPNGHIEIRQTVSCPVANLIPVSPVASPVPTSIESRKMNEATEMMMSFWRVHVTVRPKRKEPEEKDPSIFEQLEGLFPAPTSPNSILCSSAFDDTGFNTDPISSITESDCSDCSWCACRTATIERHVPTLPVFVKSPVDSLTYYRKNKAKHDKMMEDASLSDDEASLSAPLTTHDSLPTTSTSASWLSSWLSHASSSASSIPTDPDASSPISSIATLSRYNTHWKRSLKRKRSQLLVKLVAQQNETINTLLELNNVYTQLEKCPKK